jgi:3-oxoacyl-[acyl-carrier-protein] synthase I
MQTTKLDRIVVTAVGALTPVGGNAEQTTAAINAGLVAFSEYPYLYCMPQDPEWDDDLPMYVARVPAIAASAKDLERFTQLAIPALAEALKKAQLSRQLLTSTGLLLALPQVSEATAKLDLHKLLLPQLCKRTGLSLKMVNAEMYGRTGIFSQLEKAISLLQTNQLKQCIIGGADTHLIEEHLFLLDKYWRLKSARNKDGFIPGEASIMLTIETEANALARGVTPIAIIHAVGEGHEEEMLSSNKV